MNKTAQRDSGGNGSSSGKAFGEAGFLKANSKAYEWLIRQANVARAQGHIELALARLQSAAGFAATYHAGRFADGAIENVLLGIGRELDVGKASSLSTSQPKFEKSSRRRVLHVATHVAALGGHSRMLNRWVLGDGHSRHSLLITSQQERKIPEWLVESIDRSGGRVWPLSHSATLMEKALQLRKTALEQADLVVLHQDSYDVVPTLAFAVEGGPPVVVLHHADHHFWLGSAITDGIINLRSAANAYSQSRRFIRRSVILPIPLDMPSCRLDKAAARKALGMPEDQLVFLSIGRPEKYRPSGPFDFTATANKILERVPQAHMIVIGETHDGIKKYLRTEVHERLHFVGGVEDPSVHRAAADIYLESFPFGSQTALLESALMALPVVRAYSPIFDLLVTQDDAIEGLTRTPCSEEQYVAQAIHLAHHPAERVALGRALRERLLKTHIDQGWRQQLALVYQFTDALRHQPAPIPVCTPNYSAADIALGQWHAVTGGQDDDVASLSNVALATACHGNYVNRIVGNAGSSVRHAWRAVRLQPFGRNSWRILAISLLGKQARTARNAVNAFSRLLKTA